MAKGLESLEEIRSEYIYYKFSGCEDSPSPKEISWFDAIEKELKVLKIIKEHFNFDKDDIFEMDYKGKHYYMFFGRPIKKEKYVLLKKVLLDEENN